MLKKPFNRLAAMYVMIVSSATFASSSVVNMNQQQLTDLGQSTAKDIGALNFSVSDDQLKTIAPNYSETDLTKTYNSNKPAKELGSQKKWQCMSFTEYDISAMKSNTDIATKQLALDCEAIRATERTNDQMVGRYSDPLENDLVRLFTERQNEIGKNASKGNLQIECSPLGTSGEQKDETCEITHLSKIMDCTQRNTPVCYDTDTNERVYAGGNASGGSGLDCDYNANPQSMYVHESNVNVQNLPDFRVWTTGSNIHNQRLTGAVSANPNPPTNEPLKHHTTVTMQGVVDTLGRGRATSTVEATFTWDDELHGVPYIQNETFDWDGNNQNFIKSLDIYINGVRIDRTANMRRGSYNDWTDGSTPLKLKGKELFVKGKNHIKLQADVEGSYWTGSFPVWEQIYAKLVIAFAEKCEKKQNISCTIESTQYCQNIEFTDDMEEINCEETDLCD